MLIAHIADIHIRKTRRHEEYQRVLDNLINSIETFGVDRIVIAGDVVHNKTDLSPEAVNLTSLYLDKLSDVAPVDLILGNHDCVINQHNRLDSLSPIVALLKGKGKPIHLYTESGLYDATDDLTYGVFAQQDGENDWPIEFDKDENKKYIALYHGAIDGSRTSASHRIEPRILHNARSPTRTTEIHSRSGLGQVPSDGTFQPTHRSPHGGWSHVQPLLVAESVEPKDPSSKLA